MGWWRSFNFFYQGWRSVVSRQWLGRWSLGSVEWWSLLFQHALGRETFAPGLVVYNRHDSGTDGLRFFKERLGFEERQVEWLP